MTTDTLLRAYPVVADLLRRLGQAAPDALQVGPGAELFSENTPCQGFPLVLDGEVRVSRSSSDGRSLELYRVTPGELCLVSSACLFNAAPLSAHGVTTRPTTLMLIPPVTFTQCGSYCCLLGPPARPRASEPGRPVTGRFTRLESHPNAPPQCILYTITTADCVQSSGCGKTRSTCAFEAARCA
jgi:CRP-like cAMP-binding protein